MSHSLPANLLDAHRPIAAQSRLIGAGIRDATLDKAAAGTKVC